MIAQKIGHIESLLKELKSFKSKEDWDIKQFNLLRTEIIKVLDEPAKTKFELLQFYFEALNIPEDDDLPF